MTHTHDYSLQVDMLSADDIFRQANFSTFFLDNASNKYNITVTGFDSNLNWFVSNDLENHNGQFFTTPGHDNDAASHHCGASALQSWW